MGAQINLGGDLLTAITGATAGGTLDRWAGGGRDYSWGRWWTGAKQVIFQVASPTPTATPTFTPTPTPTFTPSPTPTPTPYFTSPSVEPLMYVNTTDTGLGDVYLKKGITTVPFYYPLQVSLRIIPTLRILTPPEYCYFSGGLVCVPADTVELLSYTYRGMDRGDVASKVSANYTHSYLNDGHWYTFADPAEYTKLYFEHPAPFLTPPTATPPNYSYGRQPPGEVRLYVTIRVRYTWNSVAGWSSVPPVCTGAPKCIFEDDLIFDPPGMYYNFILHTTIIEN